MLNMPRRLVAVVTMAMFAFSGTQQLVLAQTAPPDSCLSDGQQASAMLGETCTQAPTGGTACPLNSAGSSSQPASAVNMDLSSTTASAVMQCTQLSSPINIQVGSTTVPVAASTALTPAELVAACQVLSTGNQSLILSAMGNAVGGSFQITPCLSQYASNLLVPQGVTAITNAA